jgi:hypothetical protein
MGLITRQGKGSKLSIVEMDNNLLYLESLSGTTGIPFEKVQIEESGRTLYFTHNLNSIFLRITIMNSTSIMTNIIVTILSNSTFKIELKGGSSFPLDRYTALIEKLN